MNDGALDLEVTARGGRIWTPQGPLDATVLNPQGDMLGDGFPAHEGVARRLLVAWVGAARGTLELAGFDEVAPATRRAIDAPGALGVPMVRKVGDAWAVAWQRREYEGSLIDLVLIGSTIDASPMAEVGEGRLAGTAVTGDALHVLLLASDGSSLTVVTVLAVVHPDLPYPIPITLARQTVGVAPAGESAVALHVPCVQESTGVATVSWRAAPGMTGSIQLDAEGVVGDVEFSRGGLAACDQGARGSRK